MSSDFLCTKLDHLHVTCVILNAVDPVLVQQLLMLRNQTIVFFGSRSPFQFQQVESDMRIDQALFVILE